MSKKCRVDGWRFLRFPPPVLSPHTPECATDMAGLCTHVRSLAFGTPSRATCSLLLSEMEQTERGERVFADDAVRRDDHAAADSKQEGTPIFWDLSLEYTTARFSSIIIILSSLLGISTTFPNFPVGSLSQINIFEKFVATSVNEGCTAPHYISDLFFQPLAFAEHR